MSKESTDKLSSIASKIMRDAQNGGPFQVYRQALIDAQCAAIRTPKHYPRSVSDDERRLDAIEAILRPFIDAAESVAASVLSQDTTEGKRS